MDTNVTENVTPAAEAPAAAPAAAAAPQQRPFRPMRTKKKVVSERSKILPRRISGTCAVHQRQLTVAVKRARQMALIPYVSD